MGAGGDSRTVSVLGMLLLLQGSDCPEAVGPGTGSLQGGSTGGNLRSGAQGSSSRGPGSATGPREASRQGPSSGQLRGVVPASELRLGSPCSTSSILCPITPSYRWVLSVGPEVPCGHFQVGQAGSQNSAGLVGAARQCPRRELKGRQ